MRGTLAISQYGAMPLWLTDIASVERIRGPNLALRTIDMMQQAFFEQTSRLSDQGKVLVPGLTLGILGQDYVPPDSGNGQTGTGIDSTYANLLENAFQRSGILHLMAVSGGHLAVVATLVRAVCSFLLLPKRVTAIAIGASYIMLAMCVFPSDSVSRACSWVWRERASCSSAEERKPCQPSAGHVGHAHGQSAHVTQFRIRIVMRRRTWHRTVRRTVRRMAHTDHAGIHRANHAMTIAAQLFTLPIQVLIEPELPVYSIPANLVVAPFVGFSTLAGLASLAISWILPSLGFIFASLASWGTAIMEFMALNLGSGDHATIPWTGDAGGALLIILVEIIGYTTARFAGTLFARITTTEPNLPGRRLIHNPIERAKAWGERTYNALKTMKWNE